MLNFSKIVHSKEEPNNRTTGEFTYLDNSGRGIPRSVTDEVAFLKETIHHLEDKLFHIYHELKDKESTLSLREKACEQTSNSLHEAIEKLEKVKKQTNQELLKCKFLLQETAEKEKGYKYRLHEAEERVTFLSQELEISSKKCIQQEMQIAQQEKQIAQQSQQIAQQSQQIAELTNLFKFQGRSEIRPQVFPKNSHQEENFSPHFIKNAQEEDTLSLATASKKNRPMPFGYTQPNNGIYFRGLQVVSEVSDNASSETRMNTIERQVEELAADICEIKQVLMQISKKLDPKPEVTQEKVLSTINNFLKAE